MHAGLIDSGEGLTVIAAVLKRLQADRGAASAKEAWTATGLTLLDYVPKVNLPQPKLPIATRIRARLANIFGRSMPTPFITVLKMHPSQQRTVPPAWMNTFSIDTARMLLSGQSPEQDWLKAYILSLQFEREEEDTLQKVLNKYELQSLHPVEGIQSFLPSALAQVYRNHRQGSLSTRRSCLILPDAYCVA